MAQPREYTATLTTDSGGAATASLPKDSGYVHRIIINHIDTEATADVSINDGQTPALPILSIADSNADAVVHPRLPVHTTAGAPIADHYTEAFIKSSQITITVAQGGDTKQLQVRVLIKDEPTPVI